MENEVRRARGEEPLPETDGVMRRQQQPQQLDTVLIAKRIQNYCQQVNDDDYDDDDDRYEDDDGREWLRST